MAMLTTNDCKIILMKLSKKLCIRPGFISERLLSIDDKKDMLNGDLPIDALELHARLWRDNGMPDYAHGEISPYRGPQVPLKRKKELNGEVKEGFQYQKPFIKFPEKS